MPTRVIVPAEPIVTPADVPGSHAVDDARVMALIAAATEVIDGPTGFLGRALGEQTLELTAKNWGDRSHRLLYPPVIEIESVSYIDSYGSPQTVAPADYALSGDLVWFRPNWSTPSLESDHPAPVSIRYRAGYDGTDVADGGTGNVPERVKQAIILSVQSALTIGVESLFLRSIEIPDVVTKTYTVSDQAQSVIYRAMDSLLGGLQVYSL